MLDFVRSEIAEIESDRRKLRSFGFVMCGALAALGTLIAWKGGWSLAPTVLILASAAAAMSLVALAAPGLLRPVHRVWMVVAIVLGFVMTRVILGVVFFLVITPIGLVMRLLGKDPLTKGPDPSVKSYWIDKHYDARDRKRLEKYY